MAKTVNCNRCGGKGHIVGYGHIQGGVCFKCGGSGQMAAPRARKVSAPAVNNILAENMRKLAIAKVQLANHPKLTVSVDHEYYNQHIMQLAQYLNIWNSL